jgi:hypothetical protein
MKRGVVWLCWGQSFVAEAVVSARSAPIRHLDRFLITDEVGAEQAKESGAFTAIIRTRLVHANNLENSRLIDLLPDGYESFLYLDCDTHIIGDVTFGFAKAEQHGIAMAPAPNYNLSEYFGFGSTMKTIGIEPADQLMYNSGVIFFRLTESVRRVLNRWRELCEIGAKSGVTSDQVFLTLAFEQLGFVPYVLSPLYNYRGLGEYAVGKIRIWHSRHFPPANLNEFDMAWPARRFVDGVRIGPEEQAAKPSVRQLPQPMLQLLYEQPYTSEVARTIEDKALLIQKEEGGRSANEFLIKALGIGVSADFNESYFAEALHYHSGLTYGYCAEPERMAEQIRLSRTMPGPYSDQLFSDHVNSSHVTRDRQEHGIRRGMPAILFCCMPRSASATITHILGRVFDLPVLRFSIGRFPDAYIAPSWLDMFLEGGAINQDHVGPSDFNFGVLSGRNLSNLFILVRDPRAAARSQVHFDGRVTGIAGPLETRIERECVSHFIPWLQRWIDHAKSSTSRFRIHWLFYRDVCNDPAAVVRKVARIFQSDYPVISSYVDCERVPDLKLHFVTGDDDAWRAEVSEDVRRRLWSACTPDIKSLLQLQE